jgi:hypothetical protein
MYKKNIVTPRSFSPKKAPRQKSSLANESWRHRLFPADRVTHESASFAIHLWDRYDLYTVQLVAFSIYVIIMPAHDDHMERDPESVLLPTPSLLSLGGPSSTPPLVS